MRDDQDMAELLHDACENGRLDFITKTPRDIASFKGMKDAELDNAFTLSRITKYSKCMKLSYENYLNRLNSYGIEITDSVAITTFNVV